MIARFLSSRVFDKGAVPEQRGRRLIWSIVGLRERERSAASLEFAVLREQYPVDTVTALDYSTCAPWSSNYTSSVNFCPNNKESPV